MNKKPLSEEVIVEIGGEAPSYSIAGIEPNSLAQAVLDRNKDWKPDTAINLPIEMQSYAISSDKWFSPLRQLKFALDRRDKETA